jgi:hypothetical protein
LAARSEVVTFQVETVTVPVDFDVVGVAVGRAVKFEPEGDLVANRVEHEATACHPAYGCAASRIAVAETLGE